MRAPRILVANDDGVHAAGIKMLAQHLETLGEVWIIAPDRERSATSHSISLHKPLRLRQVGERRFCVDGTPTDSVYIGLHHVMPDPPDIVVSGINHGANLGNDVIYSGTVSAAMEGALFGHRAMAFSLVCEERPDRPPADFSAAAAVASELVRAALARPMPPGVLLNVNVPPLPRERLRGIKLCRLGFQGWTDCVDVRQDPRGRPYYWIGGERSHADDMPDSDIRAIEEGFVTVTPIHYDVTDYHAFSYVRTLPLTELQAATDGLGDAPLAARKAPLGLTKRRD